MKTQAEQDGLSEFRLCTQCKGVIEFDQPYRWTMVSGAPTGCEHARCVLPEHVPAQAQPGDGT